MILRRGNRIETVSPPDFFSAWWFQVLLVALAVLVLSVSVLWFILSEHKIYSKGNRTKPKKGMLTISAISTCELLNADLDHVLITFLRHSDLKEQFKSRRM